MILFSVILTLISNSSKSTFDINSKVFPRDVSSRNKSFVIFLVGFFFYIERSTFGYFWIVSRKT